MRDSKLISVVIPARNAAATLDAALGSLLRQRYRQWEAVIVDDGSADGTAAIAARHIEHDPRFRMIFGPGKGASAARNAGIASARGDWLQFLDSDDWLEPDHMQRMAGALNGSPTAQAAWCSFTRIMPDGSSDGVRIPQVGDDPFPTLAQKCPFTIHGVLIERDIVVRLGGFDEGLTTCEDWDLWQRVARTGIEWTGVPDLVTPYRTQAGSLSNRAASLLCDGWTVIERGNGPDERVAEPAVRWRSGLGSWGAQTTARKARFALWVLAGQLAAGARPTVTGQDLAGIGGDPWDADEVVAYLLDGVVIGSQVPASRLALDWARVGPVAAAALDLVAEALPDESALRRLDYLLDGELAAGAWGDGTVLRRTLLVERADGDSSFIALPEGVDRVHVRLLQGKRAYGAVTVAALGELDRFDVAEAVAAAMHSATSARARLRAGRLGAIPAPVRKVLRRVAQTRAARIGIAATRRLMPRRASGVSSATSPPPSPHRQRLATIASEMRQSLPELPPVAVIEKATEPARGEDRVSFWEEVFATENPWDYDSPYEHEKYQRQIDLLPPEKPAHALELASAEGHFTRMLAGRVGQLLATDISATALSRNRARNEAIGNIAFAQLDLSNDALPQGHDLIVCSEVLYYLAGFDELRRVASRLVEALAPGGALLTAHAFVIADDRTTTGFDWGNPYGAAGIARVLGETNGLVLEASLQTELYRIDRYRKPATDVATAPPKVEHAEVTATLDPEVERLLLRGGTTILRSEVAAERCDRVPVLMYHGVAESGPPGLSRWRVTPDRFLEQVRWLRRNGYHTLSPGALADALARRERFQGRPVVITFDDGQASFAETAWPILRAHDFLAEMFIVTGKVGGTADWDGEDGEQIPLMDVATIRRLAQEGVRFGSHFTRHVPANGLSSEELAREMIGSRLALESWLGHAPVQVAAPYTIPDPRFPALARSFGYSLLYGNRSGPAGWWDPALDLPRIEVMGDWDIDRFVETMEQAR